MLISSAEKKTKKSKHEDEDDEEFDGDEGLSPQQVEAFLNVLCDETDIAEVQLKMGGFKMKVRRSLKGGAAAAAAPVTIAAPIPAGLPAAAPVAAAASIPSVSDIDSDVEEDDGSTIAIVAPKVGLMRRGRYLKGKQVGKGPVVEIGATIKKGQVLCYIEQLGTFWPVESPQAGEIAGFVVEEGEPVEYGQEVIDILPFFGGHIIGDSKYA
jgi:biotin carboxyl carrier protein